MIEGGTWDKCHEEPPSATMAKCAFLSGIALGMRVPLAGLQSEKLCSTKSTNLNPVTSGRSVRVYNSGRFLAATPRKSSLIGRFYRIPKRCVRAAICGPSSVMKI